MVKTQYNQLCEICNQNPATHTCKHCKRKVCTKHYNKQTETCSICTQALCQICGKKLSIGYCITCGRLGCIDCLKQIDNVRRICIECLVMNKKPILPRITGPQKITQQILSHTPRK
ncbi:MAG: hypothetical protein GSR77_03075 [Desulfurococcales archaeon]|nr:hypothetical protein [Desulfurococcales archaeon]